MAQLVAVGLLGVLLTVAAIVWRNRLPQTGKGRSRYPSLGSIGDMLRMAGGRSLPVEGFEDWKLHYLRIAISALPPPQRACCDLQPQQSLGRRAKAGRMPSCP